MNNVPPRIVPTANTNGVGIVRAESDFNITRQQQENKIFIKVLIGHIFFMYFF